MNVPVKINNKLKDLLEGLVQVDQFEHTEIGALVLDSRKLKAGDAFIAVRGTQAHGLDFSASVEKSKPAVILYEPTEKYTKVEIEDIPCIAVDNLHKHVSLIAARYYGHPSEFLKITAITGTNGKTTCAYLVAQLLESQDLDVAIIGTTGSGRLNELQTASLTTPDAIRLQGILFEMCNSGVQHVVMEASSHALDQYRLDAVKIDVAAFTNLSQDHLDYHSDMTAYLAAKAKLFAFESVNTAIINVDDKSSKVLLETVGESVDLLTYSMTENQANLQAHAVKVAAQGAVFELDHEGMNMPLVSPLLGQFNVANLLLALSVMQAYNYQLKSLLDAVEDLKPPCGRLERMGTDATPTVVIDYAHTPDALDKALSTLTELAEKDIFAVFGCGGDRDKSKRPVMGAIAGQYAKRVYLTDDNPRSEDSLEIIRDIQRGVSKDVNLKIIADRAKAIHTSIVEAELQDIVLIAGKGHENYQIIGHEKISFSDHLHVQTALDVWQECCS